MHTQLLQQRSDLDRSFLVIMLVVAAIHATAVGGVLYLFQEETPKQHSERLFVVQTVHFRESSSPPVQAKVKEPSAPKQLAEPIVESPPIPKEEYQEKEVVEAKPLLQEVQPVVSAAISKKNGQTKTAPQAKPKIVKKAAAGQPAKKAVQTASKPKPQKAVVQQRDTGDEALKAKRRSLLAEAQKSIAQIESGHDIVAAASNRTTVVLPGKIEHLQIEGLEEGVGETEFTLQEMRYYEELASHLKRQLRLPEYGQVRIKLALERSGKFLEAAVLHAESKKNRQYLEQMLPKLKYPGFGTHFSDTNQHTFVIAFSNEG